MCGQNSIWSGPKLPIKNGKCGSRPACTISWEVLLGPFFSPETRGWWALKEDPMLHENLRMVGHPPYVCKIPNPRSSLPSIGFSSSCSWDLRISLSWTHRTSMWGSVQLLGLDHGVPLELDGSKLRTGFLWDNPHFILTLRRRQMWVRLRACVRLQAAEQHPLESTYTVHILSGCQFKCLKWHHLKKHVLLIYSYFDMKCLWSLWTTELLFLWSQHCKLKT